MNKAFLIGRTTKDIDLRYTESQVAVSRFTLAVNRNYTNQDGEKEADFINCVAFRKIAERIKEFVTKGSQVGIEGRIQTRNYEQDGVKKYVTEVVVDNIEFLSTKKKEEVEENEYDPFAEMGKEVALDNYMNIDDEFPY